MSIEAVWEIKLLWLLLMLAIFAEMLPESNCWGGGARAFKVPTVSGVQESLQTMPIVCLNRPTRNKQVMDFMKCRRCMEI